ncbi:hypothetical protein N431DRAFT_494223 [Stipitochalara longipes BDJ]|nr:hypothetical protein N431DRAFT_494223 [Stipitochalara longipes BDJ]
MVTNYVRRKGGGYQHHSSVKNLLASTRNGCSSCSLILNSQWVQVGGDLNLVHDHGLLETQIIARYIGTHPEGLYGRIRILDKRSLEHQISLASHWLKDCLSNHNMCLSEVKERFVAPTRVINVGSSDAIPFLHTSNSNGSIQPLKANTANRAAYQSEVPWDAIPRLFQDAIVITRSMGYRYLWIDSLCIVQDSPDDWNREITRMGSIYKYCAFMISADSCGDSSESIFSKSLVGTSAEGIQQGCHSSQNNLRGTLTPCSTKREHDRHGGGTLQSRAWVLQEEVLSPRTLRWSDNEVMWRCRSNSRSEEEPVVWPFMMHGDSMPYNWWKLLCLSKKSLKTIMDSLPNRRLPNSLLIWYATVEDFGCREITFKTDTLPAISGIAREIARHTGYHYYAGIWKEDFHNGLLWWIVYNGPNPLVSPGPSWSWASRSNSSTIALVFSVALDPMWLKKSYMEPVSEVLAIDMDISGKEPFSEVCSGSIRLRAQYRRATSFNIEMIIVPDNEPFVREYNQYSPCTYPIPHSSIFCWLDHFLWEEEDSLSRARRLCEKGAIFVQIGCGHYSIEDSILIMGIARVSELLAKGWEIQDITII